MNSLFSFIFRGLIVFYKYFISPLSVQKCRYTLSCSSYGLEAIKKHGPWKGGVLTLKRIFTCHPWGGHGEDPVP